MAGVSLHQVQRMGLQQMLAPNMQLNLQMLQAGTLELSDLVKQELERNPTLEEVPQESVSLDQPPETTGEAPRDGRAETMDDFRQEFEALKQLDDEWRDYFTQSSRNYSRSAEDEERRQFLFDSIVQPESLQEHLLSQLGTSDADGELRRAAEIIIGSLTDDGYLVAHEDMAAALVEFALEVCARRRQTSDPAAAWARALIEKELTEAFERSKRGQLLGWQERLHDICRQLLEAEPGKQPAQPPASAPAAEPVSENAMKPAREAVGRLREEMSRQWRAVVEENAPVPMRRDVLAEVFGGAKPEELDAALQAGQRLDLPLLFLRPAPEVTLDTMRRALELVQALDPVGVAARTLGECLLIQLARLDKAGGLEARIVREHLTLLATRNMPELAAALGVTAEEAQQAAENISRLEPKPGRMFGAEINPYVEPDVVVVKDRGEFVILLNDDRIPHLRISDSYREMMAEENATPEVVQYVRERIQAGKFLIRSIAQRQQTIQNIASEIIRAQREFFEKGPGHLKPLRMSDVAYRCGEEFKMDGGVEKAVCPYCGALADISEGAGNRREADCPNAEVDDFSRRRHRSRVPGRELDNPRQLGVHETTVSRASANKYMATPHGVFEIKYFFTPGYTTASGETLASQRVKDLVKELIEKEDPAKPLADQEVAAILKQRGLDIARRTVAKYRGELNIPSSSARVKTGAAAPVVPPPAP
jgi:DNA-directed RNA polymerase specialized sigma54-like protein